MSAIRLTGSTSGYAEITPSAIAGDQTFTLPGTGGVLDRLNRAGNVLQVVQGTLGPTIVSTSSSTYADAGLSASITPSSSSNKIIIAVNLAGVGKSNANVANQFAARLLRGSTTILQMEGASAYNNQAQPNYIGSVAAYYLDSPATTSSTTYKIQIANPNNTAASFLNVAGTETSTIILMEIAA